MGKSVSFRTDLGEGSGYLATPSTSTNGKGPGIVVIQEWWGLVPHIKNVVDRFAEEGFVALAPDLYKGKASTEPDTARKLMMEMELDTAGADISGAAHYLLSLPEVSSQKIGVIGFCMGGSLAIWSATLSKEIGASVAFYPGASWERHNPDWSQFKGKTAQIHCAEGDGTSSAPGIQEAKEKITSAGGQIELFDYAGTSHAFFNDDRAEVYSPEAAALSWKRVLEIFKRSL